MVALLSWLNELWFGGLGQSSFLFSALSLNHTKRLFLMHPVRLKWDGAEDAR